MLIPVEKIKELSGKVYLVSDAIEQTIYEPEDKQREIHAAIIGNLRLIMHIYCDLLIQGESCQD